MAVVVGRMVAVLEAQTSQFEARMSAAGQQLNRWTSVTTNAHRGTNLLKSGLQQLVFEGLSIMPPALARVSAGMLTLFGPGGIMLAAVAVLGIISYAFERAGKKAQEFVEEANRVREFQQGHLQMLANIGPGFQQTPGEQLATLQILRARVLDWMEKLAPATQSVVAQIGGMDPVASRAQSRIDALTVSLKGLNRAIRDLSETGANNLLPAGLAVGVKGPDIGFAKAPGAFPLTKGGIEHKYFQSAGMTTKQPSFRFTPEFGIMASMALLQGAQGGAAGLFGAAAGPVAMINPLAGAITAGIGGIFSMFDNAEERRHKKLVDTIKQLGEEVGLERVTVIFTGPDGHQVRRSLAELEESDAVERIPGPVGMGG